MDDFPSQLKNYFFIDRLDANVVSFILKYLPKSEMLNTFACLSKLWQKFIFSKYGVNIINPKIWEKQT